MRRILHCDMDAFFAAIEQRDDPSLRGRPIAVGGGGPRGVVMTASYEARPYGVRSAMPGAQARRLCPDLVFVRGRIEVYAEVGRAVRAIFSRYTPLVEPLSIDEAYLDVTEYCEREGVTATAVARAIRRAVAEELRLTVSAGVSTTKFVAKVASGWAKPDGLTVVPPERVADFVATLPVERFHGVGPATAAKLKAMGIMTGADLASAGEAALAARFGRFGTRLHELAQGIDERPVRPDRERKSVGAERTFAEDVTGRAALEAALDSVLERLLSRLDRTGTGAWRTLTLKVRTHDFHTVTRARTFAEPLRDAAALRQAARELLATPAPPTLPVRLLGVTVSGFRTPPKRGGGQLRLAL